MRDLVAFVRHLTPEDATHWSETLADPQKCWAAMALRLRGTSATLT
jgi:hypothetical protein